MEQEHIITDVGVFMIDQYGCTCGWKSNSYFDGEPWARQEAEKHLQEVKSTHFHPKPL